MPRPPSPPKLVEDGDFGPATCAALQRALNRHGAALTVDGSMGSLTNKALQKCLGVPQDGIVGSGTVSALQRKVGATAEGQWGNDTTLRLQKKLNAGAFQHHRHEPGHRRLPRFIAVAGAAPARFSPWAERALTCRMGWVSPKPTGAW